MKIGATGGDALRITDKGEKVLSLEIPSLRKAFTSAITGLMKGGGKGDADAGGGGA